MRCFDVRAIPSSGTAAPTGAQRVWRRAIQISFRAHDVDDLRSRDPFLQLSFILRGAQCARGDERLFIGTDNPRRQEIINHAKETGMRVTPAEVERRAEQLIHAWESSCPEQSFAERTLEQIKQELKACFETKEKFAAAEAQWQAARQERNTAYEKAMELLQWVVNSVKGHPKYGENSAVYTAMGYVPKNERRSGLTRRRERQTAKEPTEAS
jgi:hypothetical protein